MDTSAIDASELIFYEGRDEPWSAFPEEPVRGVVGCFAAAHAGSFDMFVVIDYDPEDKMIYAVTPRIRIDKNKNVVLGNDRKTQQFRGSVRCICQDSIDGLCHCGAKQVIENEYAASFKAAKSDDKYQVISFKNEKKYGILFEFVTKEMAKNMDTLYEPVCELEIYGNRHGKL